MRYLVIERFVRWPQPVYDRLATRGRMLPAGLEHVDGWVEDRDEPDRCYQLIDTDDPALLETWIERWRDLVDFEVVPVIDSAAAQRRVRTRPPGDREPGAAGGERRGRVDLYWIPLGAGARVVRISGRIFEAISALGQRRPLFDLYHSALEIHLPEGRYSVEMTPVPDPDGSRRGVVAGAPVGSRWIGRLRVFRYEIRRWLDGVIPDVAEAVSSPVKVTDDLGRARRIFDLVPAVPTPVWGRDELDAGEMWNSNSLVSWLIACSGLDAARFEPPQGGRAPGWDAGLAVAARETSSRPSGRAAPIGRE